MLPVRLRLCAELLRLARIRGEDGLRRVSPPPTHQNSPRASARGGRWCRARMTALAEAGLVAADRRAIRLRSPDALAAQVRAGLSAPRRG